MSGIEAYEVAFESNRRITVSEYQYYEFAPIDGPISEEGMRYARGCSTRAEVSRLRWRNVYHFGGFAGNVETLLGHYDAHFYSANWGMVRLGLAFPEGSLPLESIQPYLREGKRYDHTLTLQKSGKRFILWWELDEEGGWGWTEGEGILDQQFPVDGDALAVAARLSQNTRTERTPYCSTAGVRSSASIPLLGLSLTRVSCPQLYDQAVRVVEIDPISDQRSSVQAFNVAELFPSKRLFKVNAIGFRGRNAGKDAAHTSSVRLSPLLFLGPTLFEADADVVRRDLLSTYCCRHSGR
jgi:hypothetical protein